MWESSNPDSKQGCSNDLQDESTAKHFKHHLYNSNYKSQSVEATGPMPRDVTEQEEDNLALVEELDFEGFTADYLLYFYVAGLLYEQVSLVYVIHM